MSGETSTRPAQRGRFGVSLTVTPAKLGIALAAAAVFAVAAYLRLRGLGHAEMWGDQSTILGIALRWVKGGALPLASNKSSAGIMNPPMTEYLLALPLLFQQAIVPVAVFNALLALLSVVVCYWVVARLAGWRAALIATFLYAVNPWAVHFSRFFWNQNFVPLFSTLLVGFLLLYLAGPRRPVYLVLAFLWLAIVIQLHMAALPLVVAIVLLLVLCYRTVSLKHLLLGVALATLTFLPFLYYLKITGLADLKAMFGALGGQKANFNLAPFLLIRDLATGQGLLDSAAEWKAAVWPWQGLTTLEEWLFWASLLYAAGYTLMRGWRGFFRKQPAPKSVIMAALLLWIVVPGLFYLRHTVYLQNYYFIYLYPALFIVMGIAVDDGLRALKALLSRQTPRLRAAYYPAAALVLGALLAIGVWQAHIFAVRLDLLDSGVLQFRQAQDLDRLIAAARRALDSHPGRGLVVISSGATADASPYGVLADFIAPASVRFVEDGHGLIIPEQAVYLDTTGSGWLQSWLGSGLAELPGEEVKAGSDTWRFYDLPAAAYRPARLQPRPIGEWANGAQLWDCTVGWSRATGRTVEVTLTWKATQPGAPQVLHFFNHLVDQADGQLVAQQDGPGVHSPDWQPGDTLITRFEIPIPEDTPAGQYELRVGMYGLVDDVRVPLVGGTDALDVATVELPGR